MTHKTRREQIEEDLKKIRDLVKYNIADGTLYSKKHQKRFESKDAHGYICFHALGRKWNTRPLG